METAEEALAALREAIGKEGLLVPEGWKCTVTPRSGEGATIKVYTSPGGVNLRSIAKVKWFILNEIARGPEAAPSADDEPGRRPTRGGRAAASEEKPAAAKRAKEETVKKESKKRKTDAAPPQEEEEEEEEDKCWLYRTKKGVYGPFSTSELESFRPGFERLKALETMRVWREGKDEELDSVSLKGLLDGTLDAV